MATGGAASRLRFKSLGHFMRAKSAIDNNQYKQAMSGHGYTMDRALGRGAYGKVFLCSINAAGADMEAMGAPSSIAMASESRAALREGGGRRAIKVLNLAESRKEYDFTWLTADERLRADQDMSHMLEVLGAMPEGVVRDFFVRSHGMLSEKLLIEANPQMRRTRRPVAEQEILQRCMGHPYVNSLKASFRDHKNLYLVFPYYPGGSLKSLLLRRGGSFSGEDEHLARFFAAQLLLGVDFLRERNISHRDIKPPNLLLTEEGQLVICDFGLATRLRGGLKTFCGTAEYIAPEVLSDRTWSSRYLDYWAFGITLYEMLVGRTPFEDSSADAVFLNTLTSPILFPEDPTPPSAEAQSFLRMVLERDRSRRPTPEEMKAHSFFDGIDWEAMSAGNVACPLSHEDLFGLPATALSPKPSSNGSNGERRHARGRRTRDQHIIETV